MPRPSAFTPEIEKGILKDIASGKSTKEAAVRNGIKYATLGNRVSRGRKAASGADAEFAAKFDKAIAEAVHVWEERFKQGDKETRIQYGRNEQIISKTEIFKEKAADAWRWLQRRAPEKYGPIEYDAEAFIALFESEHGSVWAYLLRKVVNAAEKAKAKRNG